MTSLITRGLAGLLTLGTAAVAQTPASSLTLHSETAASANTVAIMAQVSDAQGPAFALYLSVGGDAFDLENSWLMSLGALNAEGYGKASFEVPEAALRVDLPVHFAAVHKGADGAVIVEPQLDIALGAAPDDCLTLTFNHTIGDDSVMVAGRIIADQWAAIGLNIAAVNNDGPNKAILFDSANPTGGDGDLATPNMGAVNNDEALGNLLIIAENDGDMMPVDGLIDVPDDEKDGGAISFDFAEATEVCGVTLVDIDEQPGSEIRLYTDGDLMTPAATIPAITLGDGSVMEYSFEPTAVDRLEVFFVGSGAIGSIDLSPCPRIVDFDEDSVGRPRTLVTGEQITDQFASIGINISATNDTVGNPDKAILFDTANPTGEDEDLMTPNMMPGVLGNDEPLGLVLIIAEDDVDVAPADGLVDDPDDEGGGGDIIFDFDFDVTIVSAKLLDVDADEVDALRLFDKDDNLLSTSIILNLPDGSVQLVEPMTPGVRKAVFDLAGSGAVTRLRFCPDPIDDDGELPDPQ